MVNDDDYITVREAARVLGRGTTRVRQHIRDGRLRSVVAHGIVWVLKADVERIPSMLRRYEKHASPKAKGSGKKGKNQQQAKVAKAASLVTKAKPENPGATGGIGGVAGDADVGELGRSSEP